MGISHSCCLFPVHNFHFSILTIESLNTAVQRSCHNIPWQLILSHNSSQKSHFLLELFHTWQTGKRSQLNLKLLLLDMVGSVSRMALIAKLVRNFIDIPRVMAVIELTCTITLKDQAEKCMKHWWKWQWLNKSLVKSRCMLCFEHAQSIHNNSRVQSNIPLSHTVQ